MNKELIADNLIRIKALQEALAQQVSQLRQHISLGEKVETDLGSVNHVESSRTNYDGAGLFEELTRLGIDPTLIGEVMVKVSTDKFTDALCKGEIPHNLVDDYTETKVVPTLRIKPKKDHNGLEKDTNDRVASVVNR